MARSHTELLAEEICHMAFQNKDFSLELERIASDMLKSFFQMKLQSRTLWNQFEEFSIRLSQMEGQLHYSREMEEFDDMVEDFRDSLHSKTPDFSQLYAAMVDQRQRLAVVHEDIFRGVHLDMDTLPERDQALIS